MGKHGPCCHCGVTTTPLWRNGPPSKPVLCNACGSRWRTKGSLANYTPLHARELFNSEEIPVSKVKSILFKPKEKKLLKIKQKGGAVESEREIPYSDQNFQKFLEADTSNRSSSGSAASYSESCAHFGTTETSDLTGSAQSNVWESQVPSKKRTCVMRTKPSSVEKLAHDLYTIMHEQQSSHLSSSEDLLYESKTPVGSFEIGSGSVLLRYPNTKAVDEESEASSLPVDNKSHLLNEAYSGSASFPIHNGSKGTNCSANDIKNYKSTAEATPGHAKRDKFYTDKFNILHHRDSPLGFIDLTGVVNFEVLMQHITHEEYQRLIKYLPSVDTAKHPESLGTMFRSTQFMEALSYFQQLLQEGIFDSSMSGVHTEELKTLKRLVLQNFSRDTWIEHFKNLKDVKSKKYNGDLEVATGSSYLRHSNSKPIKRARDTQNLHLPVMRSPKRVARSGVSVANPLSKITPLTETSDTGSRLIYDAEDFVDNDGTSCFSPRTFFATPPERSSMLCSLPFTDCSSDQDLLLDVPWNNSSVPEAELLYYPWNQKRDDQASSAAGSEVVADGEESLSNFPAASLSLQKPRHHR